MRYCPNCKKEVGAHFTAGQVVLMLILLGFMIFPGIIYAMSHTRKCPICSGPTKRHAPKN